MKTLVAVTWNDTQDLEGTWNDETTIKEFGEIDCQIISVGFLISKGPKYVSIAGDMHEAEGDYGRVTKIASGMVTKIDYLQPIEKPNEEDSG